MTPSTGGPRWKLAGAEVQRGNGIGLVLSGFAIVVLIAALLVPWWNYNGPDGGGDTVTMQLYPGITYSWGCDGMNCVRQSGDYTYSSNGLLSTGGVLQDVQTGLAVGIFVGVTCFLFALFAWVDRARRGVVRAATVAAIFGVIASVAEPAWLAVQLPGALSSDGLGFLPGGFSGSSGSASWGPSTGWFLSLVAGLLFVGVAVSEAITLRRAKSWDAPLDERPSMPSSYPPPVTTPSDRLARVDLLRQSGAITDADVRAQKDRILAPENLVAPVPIPPNVGSREAAAAHLRYLRTSGRYTPEQQAGQRANVLRVYGLSESFLFPEEELQALVARHRAGQIDQADFERRKKEILDQI